MKPQNFTTEDSEKKKFRFFKNSVNSVVASSPGEFPLTQIMQLTTEDTEEDFDNKRRKVHFYCFSLRTLLCKKDSYYISDLAYENTEKYLEIKKIRIKKLSLCSLWFLEMNFPG